MKSIQLALLAATSLFAEGKVQLIPSFNIKEDSIDVFVEVSNKTSKNVEFQYDRDKITELSVTCYRGDGVDVSKNGNKPDCDDYNRDKAGYTEKLDPQGKDSVAAYCDPNLKWKENLRKSQVKKIFLGAHPKGEGHCDSVQVGLTINRHWYRIQ